MGLDERLTATRLGRVDGDVDVDAALGGVHARRRRRRARRAGATAIALVAVVGSVALRGPGDDGHEVVVADGAEAAPPPEPLDGARLVMSTEEVPAAGAEVAIAVEEPAGATFGVGGELQRWDGERWAVDGLVRFCLDEWRCRGEVLEPGSPLAVEDIGVRTGAALWVELPSLEPGRYRLALDGTTEGAPTQAGVQFVAVDQVRRGVPPRRELDGDLLATSGFVDRLGDLVVTPVPVDAEDVAALWAEHGDALEVEWWTGDAWLRGVTLSPEAVEDPNTRTYSMPEVLPGAFRVTAGAMVGYVFLAEAPVPPMARALCPGSIERRLDGGRQPDADGLPNVEGAVTSRDAAAAALAEAEARLFEEFPGASVEVSVGFGWAWEGENGGAHTVVEVEDFGLVVELASPDDCPTAPDLYRHVAGGPPDGLGVPVFFSHPIASPCSQTAAEIVEVPDVVGLDLRAAQAALRGAGLALVGDGVADGDPVGPDAIVVHHEPPAPSRVPAGACVGLRTSVTTAEAPPDVAGLTPDAANAALEPFGLSVLVVANVAGDDLPEGVIRRAMLPRDGVVEVEVAAGGPVVAFADLPPEAQAMLQEDGRWDPAEPIRRFTTAAGDAYKVDVLLFGPCAAVDLAYRRFADASYDDRCY